MTRHTLLSACVLSLGLSVAGCSMNGAADNDTCCIFDANGLRLDHSHERVRGFALMKSSQFEPAQAERPFEVHAFAETPTPALGMHHVAIVPEWYRGTLDASGDPAKQFWFTVIKSNALDDGKERTITLVAGSLGDAAGFSVKLPARDGETDLHTGLCVQQYPNDGPPRCVPIVLNYGFIWAFVDKPSGPGQVPGPKAFWPWRLIIKTRAVPAGAFSTQFALLAIADRSGKSIREFVFRPNQADACCSAPAVPDNMPSVIVYGQPFDAQVETLTTPQQIRVEDGTKYVEAIVVGSPEETFLKAACTFAHAAKLVIDAGPSANWEKSARPCFDTPPAK